MTEPNRQSGEKEERIIEIEIERLRPFKEHPFQVKDDKEMFLLQESIEKYGILNPLIVRPVPDGYYEIISGHRRKHAAEKLGSELEHTIVADRITSFFFRFMDVGFQIKIFLSLFGESKKINVMFQAVTGNVHDVVALWIKQKFF